MNLEEFWQEGGVCCLELKAASVVIQITLRSICRTSESTSKCPSQLLLISSSKSRCPVRKVSTVESPLQKKYKEYKHDLSICDHMVFDEMVNLDENSISKEEFNKMHSKHNWKTISNFILKSDDFSFKKFLKNVSKRYFPNKELHENFKKISKNRKKHRVKPIIKNSSIRNSFNHFCPRKTTTTSLRPMKSTNTVNNAFPYAKFSRNSLMFELGTVPEFAKFDDVQEVNNEKNELSPQLMPSSAVESSKPNNERIKILNKPKSFAKYFKENFKNKRRPRNKDKLQAEESTNCNAYCYLKTNSSLCIPKSQQFLNRFLNTSKNRPLTILQKQKHKSKSRRNQLHSSIEERDCSLIQSVAYKSKWRPSTRQEKEKTRPAIPPAIKTSSFCRRGSSCLLTESDGYIIVNNKPCR